MGSNGSDPSDTKRPRIVVFGMEAAPGRGSEAAAGWGLTRSAMAFADCVLLTSTIFEADVRAWRLANPDDPLRVEIVPEASVARYFRWHRIPRFMLYLHWLRRATKVARRMHAEQPFDASFAVTYSAYWLPCRAVDLPMPSVWGPVGGAVTTPRTLWRGLGAPGLLGEVLDYVAVRVSSRLPATRRTWRKATVRLFNNEESRQVMPAGLPGTSIVLNNAPFAEITPAPPAPRERFIIFPSPLDPRKGPRLALQALTYAPPDVRLVFASDGIERSALERMAAQLGLSERVSILGWIPRAEMFGLMASAAASIHTGLREEGGVALTEAMLHGTPVIVLAHGGARTIAESTTDPERVALVAPDTFDRTARELGAQIARFCTDLSTGTTPTIDRSAYVHALHHAFDLALGVPTVDQGRETALGVGLDERNGMHSEGVGVAASRP